MILTAKNTNESWRPDPSAIMETTILAAPAGWMDVMSVPFKQGAGLRDQALVHILPNILPILIQKRRRIISSIKLSEPL